MLKLEKGSVEMTQYEYYIKEANVVSNFFEKEHGKNYRIDGVLNPNEMFKDPKRMHIVMLLKEGADSESKWTPISNIENENITYPDKKNRSKTWGPIICRTVHFLLTNEWWDKVPCGKENGKNVSGYAYINTKKTYGSRTSNDKQLDNYAQKYREMLKRQIIDCCPDVVICCQKNKRQMERLLTIMNSKEEESKYLSNKRIENQYLRCIKYNYQGKTQYLVAIQYVHPSRSICTKKEQKTRLEEAKDIISEVMDINRHQNE